MNVEIQNHTIQLNENYEFTFSGEVMHYIVGYSGFKLQFESTDHHVQRISIDVRSSSRHGKKLLFNQNWFYVIIIYLIKLPTLQKLI